MERKWLDPESEDCLLGKHEEWKDIRKFLWEHYCSDDGIRHRYEQDYCPTPWMIDGDSDDYKYHFILKYPFFFI